MPSKRDLTPEELRAWSEVTRRVKPLDGKANDLQRMIDALPAQVLEAPSESPDSKPAAPKPPRRRSDPPAPGSRANERKLRRGKIETGPRLDLHGHTQASAASILPQFVERVRAAGGRTALVITGRGRGGESVLRRNFLAWLESPEAARLVSGYAEAHRRHGGAGAFYLFLRKPEV